MELNTIISEVESRLILHLGWPAWALRTIATLLVLVLGTGLLQTVVGVENTPESNAKQESTKHATTITWEFRLFQLQYLTVFLIIMLADWLQGTNMYTLYAVRTTLLHL